jgi:prepilin peptidase CpaA
VDIAHPSAPLVVTTVVLVAAATVTDVRRRRIPNILTFPAMGAGLAIRSLEDGWSGALAAGAGCVAAPAVLMLLRAFRRLGMGDLKLSAAVGALLGPAAGALAMAIAAVAGGVLALAWALRPGTTAAASLAPFLIGVPLVGRAGGAGRAAGPTATPTLPYGVAIGAGALLALGIVRWC